jgi:hypothetical protein
LVREIVGRRWVAAETMVSHILTMHCPGTRTDMGVVLAGDISLPWKLPSVTNGLCKIIVLDLGWSSGVESLSQKGESRKERKEGRKERKKEKERKW